MNLARIVRYASEALRLMRQGRFGVLREKRARLSLAAGPLISAEALASRVAEIGSVVCIIDGAQGGGAAVAAQRSVSEWRARGLGTLQLGCDPLGNLSATVSGPSEAQVLTGRLADWPALPHGVTSIEVHSLAGFTEPGQVASWLTAATQGDVTVSIHWHDHYFICPTRHLLTAGDTYCGLPDVSVCAQCLPDNPHCLDAPVRKVDVVGWRDQWGAVMANASEIRVFSTSSGELIQQVWPELANAVRCQPHDVSHINLTPLTPAPGTRLSIGVIGRIGRHKGAAEVAALARHIEHEQGLIKITVFGTLEERTSPAVVTETGPFAEGELAALCAAHGINVFWMPSVWPETFSFVLHEMRAMGLPVLAYDVGAQADTLRREGGGRVLPLGASAEDVLSALHDLKEHAA